MDLTFRDAEQFEQFKRFLPGWILGNLDKHGILPAYPEATIRRVRQSIVDGLAKCPSLREVWDLLRKQGCTTEWEKEIIADWQKRSGSPA